MTAAQREALRYYKAGDAHEEDMNTLADLATSLFDNTPIDIGDVMKSLGNVESYSYGNCISVSVGTVMLRTHGQLAMLLEVLKGGGT